MHTFQSVLTLWAQFSVPCGLRTPSPYPDISWLRNPEKDITGTIICSSRCAALFWCSVMTPLHQDITTEWPVLLLHSYNGPLRSAVIILTDICRDLFAKIHLISETITVIKLCRPFRYFHQSQRKSQTLFDILRSDVK